MRSVAKMAIERSMLGTVVIDSFFILIWPPSWIIYISLPLTPAQLLGDGLPIKDVLQT
jgi:hypothetical protein